MELKPYLAQKAGSVEQLLNDLVKEDGTRLTAAMRHSLLAGGKRIRPVLCVAAAEAISGKAAEAAVWHSGCAIEMIHTYSLIHDDLPAMDDDDLRRGRPTCHRAFDEATAILAGDALLTLAFEVLGNLPGADAQKCLAVIRRISAAAGPRGMVEGQMRDMAAEGTALDAWALQEMHGLKTGAMIEASVASGAILAGADPESLSALIRYARKIGLAFQVADDILNVEGDPEKMGKAVGTDQLRKKSTYPSLMGMDGAKAFAEGLVAEALDALIPFDKWAGPLRAIAAYIITRKR